MKQKKLLKELYAAWLSNDTVKAQDLMKQEFQKVFARKAKGKAFNGKWTIIR